jgi:hypothetical protein
METYKLGKMMFYLKSKGTKIVFDEYELGRLEVRLEQCLDHVSKSSLSYSFSAFLGIFIPFEMLNF